MTEDVLQHYGVLRRSGRYPWGSGKDHEERSRGFLGYVKELRAKGVSDVNIARGMGITTTELRAAYAIARNEVGKADAALALRLKDKGMSNVAIGQRMKIGESSVRDLLDPAMADKRDVLLNTASLLKERLKDGGGLDIGTGVERHLGISSTRLSTAVAILREEGYEVRNIQVPQLGGKNKTTVKTLVPPGSPKFIDPATIKPVGAYSDDGGHTYPLIEPPVNVSSKRIGVVYAEEGGSKADGVIYLRPGVQDLSLGGARYAQVRIAVDGTHYLKGMAMYKNDLPAGIDMQFHTSKSSTGNKLDAMKPQSSEENPFGATIHQRHYTDASGKKKLSPLNIVNEQGDWTKWSKTLSSQFLSKQGVGLARRQLDMALKSRAEELQEIRHLTNPVVKRKLLEDFADNADSASVHLKAAALPRQTTQVILPFPKMKENEVYAPQYRNGERVVLVRHPHGGPFEIPELTVNNRYAEARSALGNAPDAIGIHPKVAERLSGADFDGDHVLVIPNPRKEIKTAPALEKLKNFDPKQAYPPYDGMKTIDGGVYNTKTKSVEYKNADGSPKKPSGRAKQHQMGEVSNLITDMSVRGASPDELARAVRHSMVVIDAEKHHLNVRQSFVDNGIASLKESYQGRGATGRLAGASTLISRSGNAKIKVPEKVLRKASEGGPVDPETGKLVYVKTNRTYVDKTTGKTKVQLIDSKPLLETEDARTLSSGMPIEEVYASHSNALKALANQARKEAVHTGGLTYSPSAAKTYSHEVAKLNADLNLALKNAPLERQAQLVAGVAVKARLASNPGIDPSTVKKIKNQELTKARARLGAKKEKIQITEAGWQAIQAGAITTSKLGKILDNADADQVRKLATPRAATVMTPSKLSIAKARIAAGYTQAEVAESLGVPVSTLNSALLR